MEFIGEKEIKLDKELNELDLLVLRFVKVLEKQTDYVLVSGYVAILLGRTRTTEDVDIFIPRLSKEKFGCLYKELLKEGFWCVKDHLSETGGMTGWKPRLATSSLQVVFEHAGIPPVQDEWYTERINADAEEELYSMLNEDNLSIRLAERGKAVPNIEIKFVRDKLDELSLREKIKVVIEKGELIVSDIPLQIAYKKLVLKSQKDLEDARHLQRLFGVSEKEINKYKILLKEYGRI